MKRREFISLVGGVTTWPLAARAQQSDRVRRVGVLMNGVATNTVSQSYVAAFEQALNRLGWSEGRNVRIDVRWNASDPALARIYAAHLMGFQPYAILSASTANLIALRPATVTLP